LDAMWLRHNVKLLRSRPACVGVATRLGWRLAWETRYLES
jgi:hypothetical protein